MIRLATTTVNFYAIQFGFLPFRGKLTTAVNKKMQNMSRIVVRVLS